MCVGFMGMFLVYETLPHLADIPLYVCIHYIDTVYRITILKLMFIDFVIPTSLFIIVALLVKLILVPHLMRHETDPMESAALITKDDEVCFR